MFFYIFVGVCGGGMQISPGDLICDIETDKATIGWEAQVCVYVCICATGAFYTRTHTYARAHTHMCFCPCGTSACVRLCTKMYVCVRVF